MKNSLKDSIQHLMHQSDNHGLSIDQILINLGVRSHALLILFFSIPFVQPVPMVGLSVPFGFVITLFGFYYMINKAPWLPMKIKKVHVKGSFIQKCGSALIKILQKTERMIKPRMITFVKSPATKMLNGVLIIIFAVLLAMPFPIPFSNSVPAYFLIFNALAILEEDGILLLISYAIAIAGFIFFAGIGAGVVEIWDMVQAKLATYGFSF